MFGALKRDVAKHKAGQTAELHKAERPRRPFPSLCIISQQNILMYYICLAIIHIRFYLSVLFHRIIEILLRGLRGLNNDAFIPGPD
jgi:hypothetical protein